MNVTKAALALAAILAACTPRADDRDPQKAARELLALTRTDQAAADTRDQIQRMVAGQLRDLKIPDSMKEAADRYQKQVVDLVYAELDPAKLESTYVGIYTATFTPEELDGLVAFFKTPVGRAYAAKLPSITSKMMDVGRAKLKDLTPQLQKLHDDFQTQLTQAGPASP
jgi:hypothetical protein